MNNINVEKILSELSPAEREATLKLLSDIKETGKSSMLDKLYQYDYEEIPVDIETFITDRRYAGEFTGGGKNVYPYWKKQLKEIFSGKHAYSEVALTGSIGIGKSTIAVLGLAYVLYKLMCLKDPHDFYNIGKGGYIYIVFFNATLALSQGVAYTKLQGLLQMSPWFMERGIVTGTKNLEYVPNKPIRFTVGSQMEHSLGKDIFAGMLDEINFVKGADVHMEQSKIMKTYNSVLERMRSRFMIEGKIAGCLFMVSSKKSESDFIESYIQKQKNNPDVYVCDARLWDVKPSGTYSGRMFLVAVGGSNMQSRIIEDGEDVEFYKKQGYDILEVPIEFKSGFEMDIQAALMNVAGISISYVTKFITYDAIAKCYNKTNVNPFKQEILTIGMHDSYTIQEFFIPDIVPEDIYSKPLYIHIDTSLKGDKTGIGCIANMGFRYASRYNIQKGGMETTKEMVYHHVFSVDIQCPKGSEISFQKTREFIYYLKHTLGWNIKGISLDGFQSFDSRQQFEVMGFKDSKIISLDKTPDGYLVLKSAIYERRISLQQLDLLEKELIQLERNNMTGKVDHPVDGSKDCADGLAGALYNAFLHKDNVFDAIEDNNMFLDVNSDLDTDDDKTMLLNSIVSPMVVNPMQDEVPLKDAFHEYIDSMVKGDSVKFLGDTSNNDGDSENVKVSKESVDKKTQDKINRKNFEEAKRRQSLGVYDNIGGTKSDFSIEDINDGLLIF